MLIAILVIQDIACAFFCFFVAKEKGRNPQKWFILGLLFGLFSLIALAAIPSYTITKTIPKNVDSGEVEMPQLECEECGKSEFDYDGFEYSCKHCGWKTA